MPRRYPDDHDEPYPESGESDSDGYVPGCGYRDRSGIDWRNEPGTITLNTSSDEDDTEVDQNDGNEENENNGEGEGEQMDVQENPHPPAVTEECLLCKQKKSIIRFLPCGDSGICKDCSENWSHCCKCNTEIQSRVPMIYPGNVPGDGSECVVCTEPIQARIGLVPCGHTNC